MNCTICNQPIVLNPSAEKRAKMYGKTPAFYISLFRQHNQCALTKRAKETQLLIQAINRQSVELKIVMEKTVRELRVKTNWPYDALTTNTNLQ